MKTEFDLAGRIIGLAMKIHSALGVGFLESVYHKALAHELQKAGISFESEKPLNVLYDGILVGEFVADLLIENELIVELKAVQSLATIHEAQTVNYLVATGKDIGLVINFGGERLEFKKKFRQPRLKIPSEPPNLQGKIGKSRSVRENNLAGSDFNSEHSVILSKKMNFLTELREGLSISWSAIRANKLRSILTTLGIVIGIFTVTMMGTAIEGLNRSFMRSISSIGTDVLYVNRYSWFIQSYQDWVNAMKNPAITPEEIEALQRNLTLASAIAPAVEDDESVKYQKRGSGSVSVIGTTEQYLFTSGVTLDQGRFLSAAECDSGRPVCVIGSDLATNLFRKEFPIGEKVLINKHEFEVVGVLEKQGGFSDSGGADNSVIVPLQQFLYTIDRNPDYGIQVKARNLDELDDAKEELRTVLRRFRHVAPGDPDNFAINQQDEFLDLFHKVAGTIGAVGLFITGLALFVGGIGIMNIMFVSVAERTREIGVRKAIGAKRRTIMLQFLIEAACICVMGGTIALLISWPATLLLRKAMPATLSPEIVLISLSVSALTGILSGLFPAWRAARMNPVDALRNE